MTDRAQAGQLRRVTPALTAALVVLAALLLTTARPQAAEAHGGKTALRLTAGPYQIEALVSRSGGTIDETLTVKDASSGGPVTAGVLLMNLEGPDGETRGPFIARASGGVFELRYTPPSGSGWRVSITIQGPLGEVTVTHPYVEPASALGDWVVTAIVLVGLIVVPFVAYRWWLTPKRQGRAPRARAGPADQHGPAA